MLSCLICQDAINENPTDANHPWVLSCGHVYHKLCIDESLRRNNNCPKCRKLVTNNFRLYPEVLNREGTVTFLQDCVQSAELQFERQKKICREKDTFIQGLQDMLEESESKYTDLRTSQINYVKSVLQESDKQKADIKKLEEEKSLLNRQLNKSAKKVARHEVTIGDLQRKLQEEKQAKQDAESRLNQQINSLNGLLDKAKQETLAVFRSKNEEIAKQRAKVVTLLLQVEQAKVDRPNNIAAHNERASVQIENLADQEPAPSRPDPAVDSLMRDFERIALPSHMRKRKSSEDIGDPWSTEDAASVKQLRSQSRDDTSPRDDATSECTSERSVRQQSVAAETTVEGMPPEARRRRTVRRMLKVVRAGDRK